MTKLYTISLELEIEADSLDEAISEFIRLAGKPGSDNWDVDVEEIK